MRRITNRTASALAAFGLVVLPACSGGNDTRSLGPVPTAPSTVPPPTTTTTAFPSTTTTSTTARPQATTAPTTAPARVVGGIPQVTASPVRAPVGAVVRIEGTGFTGDMWGATSLLWLAEKAGCNLYAPAENAVTISPTGRLTGQFTVPRIGNCRMSDIGERPVTSGSYRIAFTCTACIIGEVEVTTTAGPCYDVGFTPNGDDVAGEIMATGVGCVEAEAMVREAGAQARAVGGPARVEVDGWVCVRVSQNEGRGLPSSEWECTSRSRKVTFHRV